MSVLSQSGSDLHTQGAGAEAQSSRAKEWESLGWSLSTAVSHSEACQLGTLEVGWSRATAITEKGRKHTSKRFVYSRSLGCALL